MAFTILRNKICPNVSLSRDSIISLSLEAACNISLSCHSILGFTLPDYVNGDFLTMLTEKDFYDVLDRHPEWENRLNHGELALFNLEDEIQEKGKVEIEDIQRESLYSLLCLASMKRRFRVCKNFASYSNPFLTSGGPNIPLDFPVSLFFHSDKNNYFLGAIGCSIISYYNQEHRFSRWLIAHHKQLKEQVPGICDRLVRTMVSGDNVDRIQSELNNTLSFLERFPGNPFGVTQDLYIQDGELYLD